ncbi:MAG: fibronectin type III domain-containing protein, partial [Bacteroidales bacterium]|nr:fibronectin type III domain-containing protein [Bacteroidales bacterium]
MKNRFLVAALLLAGAVGAQAQYSDLYYHRVGDTIEWRSEIGYYAWWNFEYYYANNLPLRFFPCDLPNLNAQIDNPWYCMDSAVLVQRFYTPTPLRVVGLAGGCLRTTGHLSSAYGGDNYIHQRDTNEYKDYFVIYDALPDSFPLVGKTEWNPFDPYRMLHLKHHFETEYDPDDTSYSCCRYGPKDMYLGIYEYYFDSAITVQDSFYVGGTCFGGDDECTGAPRLVDMGPKTYYWTVSYGDGHDQACEAAYYISFPGGLVTCALEPGLYKSKYGFTTMAGSPNRTFAEAPWVWQERNLRHVLIYPLIEVDTTVPPASACIPVENIQATVSGSSATVTWDGFPNYSHILLRYGKTQLSQSQWSEIDVTGNTLYTLTNLEPMSRYSVTLKAECETSKKETPWSTPVTFYVADTSSGGGTNGVEAPTLLSQLTFLQPNPAQD